jgi:hypothetical protein
MLCFCCIHAPFPIGCHVAAMLTQDEIVLVTSERPDGTCARIIFRNGGFDDAATLEKLCEKVSNDAAPLGRLC